MRVLIVTAVPAERDAVVRGFAEAAETAETDSARETGQAAGTDRAATEVTKVPKVTEVAVPGGVLHRLVRPGRAPLTVDVLAAGVGPAAAAAGTATALTAAALARTPYDLAVSAGIGGGFTDQPSGAPGAPGTPDPAGASRTPPTHPSPAPRAPLGSVVVAEAIVVADLGAETPEGFAAVTDLGFGTVEHRPPPRLVAAVAEATGAVPGAVLTVSTVTGSADRAAELLRRHPRATAEAMEGFGVAEAAAAQSVPVLELRAVSNPVGPRDRAAWRIGEALDALAGTFRSLAPVLGTRTWKEARSA